MSRTPQVSISTAFCYDVALEKQLPLIRAAGFTHVSLGANVDHRRHLMAGEGAHLREVVAGHGLAIDTLHARSLDASNSFRSARNNAMTAANLGAPTVVLHASSSELAAAELPGLLEDLSETCATLSTVAASTGVTYALENVGPGPAEEVIVRALEASDAPLFGLCYDSSNAAVAGEDRFDLLRRFPGRVAAVHLSDRDGPGRDHLLPGEGAIDWRKLCAALRSARYRRPVLIEAIMRGSRYRRPRTFLQKAYAAGRRIWRAIHRR
jgi:sugar phosphate isomerase/epimerase